MGVSAAISGFYPIRRGATFVDGCEDADQKLKEAWRKGRWVFNPSLGLCHKVILDV